MRRLSAPLLVVGVLLAGTVVIVATRQDSGPAIATLDVAHGASHAVLPETAGLCPWRTPDADRLRFFPGSTGYEDETLLLSRHRNEIVRSLGHAPNSADNVLPLHWVLRAEIRMGAVITRATRGESGVIELVLAVGQDGAVVGAKLQRLREPDEVARILQSPAYLGAFRGKTAHSAWRLGQDIPDVPPTARVSATALLDSAHTMLSLLEVGRNYGSKSSAQLKALQHTHDSPQP